MIRIRQGFSTSLPRLATTCVAVSSTAALAQEAGGAGQSVSAPAMPSLWDLAIQGGWFMIPIAVASVVTIAFTLERLFGLRRGRNLPRRLIRDLREQMSESRLDPRKLWEACDGNRSPLANVVRACVLKTGRPQAELEKAAEDAVGRETEDMMRNMRPINVVASISPLLGLLGTVQGLIMAFMVTSTTSSTGTAKAQELAHGIYTALVTTFAGLCVAVVSVVLANYLEGRIERLLKQMEAIFLDLLPQLERYEGRLRITESTDPADGGIRIKTNQPAAAARSAGDTAADIEPPQRKLASRKTSVDKPDAASRTVRSVRPAAATGTDDGSVAAGAVASADTLRANFDR